MTEEDMTEEVPTAVAIGAAEEGMTEAATTVDTKTAIGEVTDRVAAAVQEGRQIVVAGRTRSDFSLVGF